MADMNKDLLDMQKKRQDLNPASKPEAQQINVDKAVFVGSTAELIKQIKANK
jgi:quinolinate synthase